MTKRGLREEEKEAAAGDTALLMRRLESLSQTKMDALDGLRGLWILHLQLWKLSADAREGEGSQRCVAPWYPPTFAQSYVRTREKNETPPPRLARRQTGRAQDL